MLSDRLSTIQRLLVIQLDPSAAPAIADLQQHLDITIIHLEIQEDGSRLRYVIHQRGPLSVYESSQSQTIEWIRDQQVDAAIVFTPSGRSPYVWAYRCYLAGVPLRIGLSQEFGGQVLSHEITPPGEDGGDRHLYLLRTCGLISTERLSTPSRDSRREDCLHSLSS